MSLTDKLKDVVTWTAPILKRSDQDELLMRAKTYKEVRDILAKTSSKDEYDTLEARLQQHIGLVHEENQNLYRFAKLVDTYDKLLVPVDALADYMKIMGGVGYGLSVGKELAEAPAKIAYGAYYLGKTRDLRGFLENIVYEGLSFFLPGSVLDLTNHYVKQAEKYAVKTAVKRFTEEVKKQQAVKKLEPVEDVPRDVAVRKAA